MEKQSEKDIAKRMDVSVSVIDRILNEISVWMRNYSESIYGCTYSSNKKPENGRITQNGKILYYHVTEMSIGGIPLYGIHRDDVEAIYLLSDRSELQIMDNWIVNNYPDIVFIDIKGNDLPDPIDTVIKIILK